MSHAWQAVFFREMLILRRRFFRQIFSWSVAPLLYLIAFGYGMGRHVSVQGVSYVEFLIPGLLAMTSMTQAFAIGSEINIARFYWHIFEEFQAAPMSHLDYVLGEVLAGLCRAVLAGLVIIGLGALFGVFLSYNLYFWIAFVLNSLVFSALAVALAMLVQSHADQAFMNNFIITPMAFLGGTFFPLAHLPEWAQKVLQFLPITHAASAMREAAFGKTPTLSPYGILAGLGMAAFVGAVLTVDRAKD
ncbi:ABC transporter permease [Desulfosoma sp.]|uniref:ABC transporter permease n=1 Tax=Desulfosoma sp. TaxID=2603217 RepID=UPI0040499756